MFPQAMNYIVVSLLCDQFDKLNKEFSKCVGDRGEFHGNFEQFRQRHQTISRSVKEADRFLMISNVAGFCCHMLGIIVVLFCLIFYRQETVSYSAEEAFLCFLYLTMNLFGILLSAGLAIFVNNKVTLIQIATGVIGHDRYWKLFPRSLGILPEAEGNISAIGRGQYFPN